MSSTPTALSATSDGSPTSTIPPFFTDNPASSTSTPAPSNGFGNTSTPLYLFTFLATLFVLLAVSCAIVLRSFYLRRQMRRRYETAIAAGLLPTTGMPGSRRRRNLGEKPVLHDAAIAPARGEKWDNLTPISAKVANIPPKTMSIPPPQAPPSRLAMLKDTFKSLPNPFRRHPSSQAPSDPCASPIQDPLVDAHRLQVSVLIAMPRPRGLSNRDSASFKGKGRMDSGYWDDEEEEGMPDVAIGVSQVGLKKDLLLLPPPPPPPP